MRGQGSRKPASHLHKRVGKYLLGRTIGEGTYAKVKYGQHADSGEAVAVKVLDKEQLVRSGMVEQIKREITILKQIHHPHIVNLLEVMSSRDKIFMVMELVTGGELFDKIVAEGPMKEPAARRVFSQLLDAVAYCHQQGVYHRDLKPENVLLSSNGNVKLSDFGLGALPNPGGGADLLRTTCGTPNYVAPEVLSKKGYQGGPADIWSLGVVLYVILAGCLPFDEDDLVALFHKISAAAYEVPPWLSEDACSLLAAMLNPKPEARATVQEIWQHPWMRGELSRRSAVDLGTLRAQQQQGGQQQRGQPHQEQQPAAAKAPADDPFGETVQPVAIQAAAQQQQQQDVHRRLELSPSALKRPNAFELIKSGLDISALFEARDDVVTRRTRFSSRASAETITESIENAAVAVGGRVARQDGGRLRLYIPNPRGTMQVLVELFEVLPGTHMVDLQKVVGNTVEFHKWYADLTHALSSIISKRQPGAGDMGARAAAARRRDAAANGHLRTNAFELIARSVNLGDMFEEDHATSRHVQFSSRREPGDILSALEAAAADLGGTSLCKGSKRTVLTVPVGGGRSMKLQAHLFEVLTGVHVCQIDKVAGSSMDFMRTYAQLAQRLQPVMMKCNAFPTATHPRQLMSVSSSMNEAQARAILEMPYTPSSPSASEGAESSGHGRSLLAQHLDAALLPDRGSSLSQRSLGSVPEEGPVLTGSRELDESVVCGGSPGAQRAWSGGQRGGGGGAFYPRSDSLAASGGSLAGGSPRRQSGSLPPLAEKEGGTGGAGAAAGAAGIPPQANGSSSAAG